MLPGNASRELKWSLYFAVGQGPLLPLLLWAHVGIALAYALGIRSRLSSILLWVFSLSLQNRIPVATQGGDAVLRFMIFFSMFLPVGACWSVDAWLSSTSSVTEASPKKPQRWSPRVVSGASTLILLQLAMVYVFTAALKTHKSWRTTFMALSEFTAADTFTTSIGRAMHDFPVMNYYATMLTYYLLEWLLPILVFLPVGTTYIRLLAVPAFIGFHLMIYVAAELGGFSWACIGAWFLFLPTMFWDRLARIEADLRRASRATQIATYGLIISVVSATVGALAWRHVYLDKFVGLGVAGVVAAGLAWLVHQHVTGADSKGRRNGKTEESKEKEEESFMAGEQHGRQAVEQQLAKKTQRELLAVELSPPPSSGKPSLLRICEVVFFAYIFLLILFGNLRHHKLGYIERQSYPVQMGLRLDQKWDMFAPGVFTSDGWPVAEGTLEDGTKLDVFKALITRSGHFDSPLDVPFDPSKPEQVTTLYPFWRWRKYLVRILTAKDHKSHHARFLKYLCLEYNRYHRHKVEAGEDGLVRGRLLEVSLTFVRETTIRGDNFTSEARPYMDTQKRLTCPASKKYKRSNCREEDMSDKVREALEVYRGREGHKAFFISEDCSTNHQAFRWYRVQDAVNTAADKCEAEGKRCRVYDIDGHRVDEPVVHIDEIR